ncbi:MAG: vWA domain-containing protein [Planctomycetota bacterium]
MKKVKVFVLATLLIAMSAIGGAEDWGPAKVAYDMYMKRHSLQMHTRGWIKLAQTGHKGAMSILPKTYAKPEVPKDQVKYLLASICANYLSDEEHLPAWTTWRGKHQKKEDAWLWYRALQIHEEYKGSDELFKTASEHKELFIRAAALEALAKNGNTSTLAWWTERLDEERMKKWSPIERIVMLETAARCYAEEAQRLGEDEFRKMGLKLIPQIGHEKTHSRTKVVMARYFQEIFGGRLWINAKPWLNKLLNPSDPEEVDEKYAEPVPPTTFVGIEAAGTRIVYVIDMSDSMLEPLSKKQKEEIKKKKKVRRGPITGGGEEEEEEEEEEEAEEEEDPMPWGKIRTRFDAAREYLKLSLNTLKPEQHFCVIFFGTEAAPMKSTKGLMPASPTNIKRAIAELNKIRKGPATKDRKFGTLRGNTNMHGGLHRAFKVTKSKMVKMWEYVDASTFTEGADTIFLLSDGDPTWDDWAKVDQRDPDDQTGDPESRTKHEDQEQLNFPGPYGYRFHGEYLPDDVRRLNLFRKCEIHCIGIGNVSYSLLQSIAQAGNGVVKMVGGE